MSTPILPGVSSYVLSADSLQPDVRNDQPSSASTAVSQAAQKIICDSCHKEMPARRYCGRCKVVNYCNADCQAKAWPVHKERCGKKLDDIQDIEKAFAQVKKYPQQDVVAYVKKAYSDSSVLSTLKREGYKGLRGLSQEKAKQLLDNQEYNELLKYVWTEEDVPARMLWLEPVAKAGHVIFMFELSAAFTLLQKQKPLNDEQVEQAYKWHSMGMHFALLDAACIDDKSTVEAVTTLLMIYAPKLMTRQSQDQAIVQLRKKWIREWLPTANMPPPAWLQQHTLEYLAGRSQLAPPKDWLALRIKRHCSIVEAS